MGVGIFLGDGDVLFACLLVVLFGSFLGGFVVYVLFCFVCFLFV